MSLPVVPSRFRLTTEELAEIVIRAARLGIAQPRVYAAFDVRWDPTHG